jgi:hypothetical protein
LRARHRGSEKHNDDRWNEDVSCHAPRALRKKSASWSRRS